MSFKDKLNKYAQLVVEVGSNVQEGDTVSIAAPVESAEFARMLAENSYKAGAHEVIINWRDDVITRLAYENQPVEVLEDIAQYAYDRAEYYAKKGQKSISISAADPELLKGIDAQKIQRASKAMSEKFQPLRKYTMNDINSWTVISVPTQKWAEKVFPNSENPVEDLWEAIFKTVRVDKENPIKEWEDHLNTLTKKSDWLNEMNFEFLRYKSSNGTDLEIRLPEGHIWTAASSLNSKGESFVPNMPTEEVFTLPHKDGVNGVVHSAKPLVYAGNVIDEFWLKFEDGAVVDFDAKKGKETLQSLFDKDERARRLGEVALVPFDSPISNSNILFFNTLFDENASCHLALGKAYPTTIKNGENMTDEELAEHGVNDSYAHEDFMVGTEDLDIIGVKHDGSEVQVFKNGNWA
ncbi:aminopeptidase [uncultured Helcococcus sp.]|uniref:aminopeptidase n=1 Tax=uncultured Helcococcus sp. TaxID=1072508 RepID=UPI00288C2F51|nr:aminopeptidase [uncultured Helcococcus sp.]